MKINNIQNVANCHQTSFKAQEKPKTTPVELKNDENFGLDYDNALKNQNLIIVKTPTKNMPFNVLILEDKSLEEVFSDEELIPNNKGINVTELLQLVYGYMAEQIRHLEATGNLIGWKERSTLERLKEEEGSVSDERKKEFLEQEKELFKKEIEEKRQKACASIDSLTPTTKEHTVYRVINDGIDEISKEYFNKVNSFKEGEIVKLDSIPIYVSSSGKKVMDTYAGNPKNTTLFKIKLPVGSKLFKFPKDGIEQLLMKPNAKFKVLSNEEFIDNFHLINLEYIPE